MAEVSGTRMLAILVKKVDMALVTRTSPWLMLQEANLFMQDASTTLPSYLLWVFHMRRAVWTSKRCPGFSLMCSIMAFLRVGFLKFKECS